MNKPVNSVGLIEKKCYYVFLLLCLYFPSHREFEAIVIEIRSIARRARNGSNSNTSDPVIGTNPNVTTGNNTLLYTKPGHFKSKEKKLQCLTF